MTKNLALHSLAALSFSVSGDITKALEQQPAKLNGRNSRYLTVEDLKAMSDSIYAREKDLAGKLQKCASMLKIHDGNKADIYFTSRGRVHLDVNPAKVSERAANAWKSCFEGVPGVTSVTMEMGATPWGETRRPDNWNSLTLNKAIDKKDKATMGMDFDAPEPSPEKTRFGTPLAYQMTKAQHYDWALPRQKLFKPDHPSSKLSPEAWSDHVKSAHASAVWDALNEGKDVPRHVLNEYPHFADKPHQLTQAGYVRLQGHDPHDPAIASRIWHPAAVAKAEHQTLVRDALARGEKVRDESLSSYPELKAEAKKNAPSVPESLSYLFPDRKPTPKIPDFTMVPSKAEYQPPTGGSLFGGDEVPTHDDVKKPAPRAERAPKKPSSRVLGSDYNTPGDRWDADSIHGYTDGAQANKNRFHKDARAYLTEVAAKLREKGYQAHKDPKTGKEDKIVSSNQSGVAGSGDVSLIMKHPDGHSIHASVSASPVISGALGVKSHPQHVTIMARTSRNGEKYATGGTNRWPDWDTPAADLAEGIHAAANGEHHPIMKSSLEAFGVWGTAILMKASPWLFEKAVDRHDGGTVNMFAEDDQQASKQKRLDDIQKHPDYDPDLMCPHCARWKIKQDVAEGQGITLGEARKDGFDSVAQRTQHMRKKRGLPYEGLCQHCEYDEDYHYGLPRPTAQKAIDKRGGKQNLGMDFDRDKEVKPSVYSSRDASNSSVRTPTPKIPNYSTTLPKINYQPPSGDSLFGENELPQPPSNKRKIYTREVFALHNRNRIGDDYGHKYYRLTNVVKAGHPKPFEPAHENLIEALPESQSAFRNLPVHPERVIARWKGPTAFEDFARDTDSEIHPEAHLHSFGRPYIRKGLTAAGRRRHLAEARKHWTGKDPVCPDCGAEYEWADAEELGQDKGKCNRCGSDREPVMPSELKKGATGIYNKETGRMEWSGQGDAGAPREGMMSRIKTALSKPAQPSSVSPATRASVTPMTSGNRLSLPDSVHTMEGVRHVQSGPVGVSPAGYAHAHLFAAKSARSGAAGLSRKLKEDGWTVGPAEKVEGTLHRQFVARRQGVAMHISVQHRGSSWERSQGLPGGTQVKVRGSGKFKSQLKPAAQPAPAQPAPPLQQSSSLHVPSAAQSVGMAHVKSVTEGDTLHHYLTHQNPQAALLSLRERLPGGWRIGRVASSVVPTGGGEHVMEYRFHAHDPATGQSHRFYSVNPAKGVSRGRKNFAGSATRARR